MSSGRHTTPMLLPRKRNLVAWNAAGNDGLDRPEDICNRVRRRLVAAKVQVGITWEELFRQCDKNNTQTLDWKELKLLVRELLKVPPQTVCDHELRVLFGAADEDGSAALDVVELLKYLQHGPRRPEDEAARLHQRMDRVRRCVHMALAKLGTGEAGLRRLFRDLDLDDSTRLSQYEFNCFVREHLDLSRWDVMTSDLDGFYRQLDKNGDGIDVAEFLAYIRQTNNRAKRQITGPESFYVMPLAADAPNKLHRRRKTYREELEAGLARSESQPAPRLRDAAFTSVGRERRPASRNALTASAVGF